MSLSKDEIEQLTNIVEKNKRQGTPTRATNPKSVTDESVALVTQSGRSDLAYHAYADGAPACGWLPSRQFKTLDIEAARVWYRPCKSCYPEGDQ